MSEWEDIRRQARAVIGEEEPLRLDLPERDGAPVGRLFVDHAAPALAVHRCRSANATPRASPVLFAISTVANRVRPELYGRMLGTGHVAMTLSSDGPTIFVWMLS